MRHSSIDGHFNRWRTRTRARRAAYQHATRDVAFPVAQTPRRLSAVERVRLLSVRHRGLKAIGAGDLGHSNALTSREFLRERITREAKRNAELREKVTALAEPLVGRGPGRLQVALSLVVILAIDYLVFKIALQPYIDDQRDISLLALMLGVLIFGSVRAIGATTAALVDGWGREEHRVELAVVGVLLAGGMALLVALLVGANSTRTTGLSAVGGGDAGDMLGKLLLPAQGVAVLCGVWIDFQRTRAARRRNAVAELGACERRLEALNKALEAAELALNEAVSQVGLAEAQAANDIALERANSVNDQALFRDKHAIHVKRRGLSEAAAQAIANPETVEVDPLEIHYPEREPKAADVLTLPDRPAKGTASPNGGTTA